MNRSKGRRASLACCPRQSLKSMSLQSHRLTVIESDIASNFKRKRPVGPGQPHQLKVAGTRPRCEPSGRSSEIKASSRMMAPTACARYKFQRVTRHNETSSSLCKTNLLITIHTRKSGLNYCVSVFETVCPYVTVEQWRPRSRWTRDQEGHFPSVFS